MIYVEAFSGGVLLCNHKKTAVGGPKKDISPERLFWSLEAQAMHPMIYGYWLTG